VHFCVFRGYGLIMDQSSSNVVSRWPHRWAVVLACATFPLLWVGGLVTTTDAGMAVPDWPTTYGYNLFLYPWSTWLAGPWDLFVEHGHRLLGATVGMITIGLVVAVWRSDGRRWMRGLALAALVLVVFQGVLGGLRVRLDERTLAMLHGITGPLFFAVAVAMVVFTSRRWQLDADRSSFKAALREGDHPQADGARPRLLRRLRKRGLSPSGFETPTQFNQAGGHIGRLAVVTCILVYLQIVLGAVLRHVPVAAEPGTFALAVRFHLFMAGIVTLHVAMLAWRVLRHGRVSPLRGLAFALVGLLFAQLLLGAGTWIVKFSAPSWAAGWVSTGFAIQDGGWLQTHVITAHVAVGSLLLATSLAMALFAQRLLPSPVAVSTVTAHRLEAAI
jgi:cytochrome c oxidase assembly protein subunit 15